MGASNQAHKTPYSSLGRQFGASDGAVSATRTLLYNQLRGTVGSPVEYSARTIINQAFIEHRAGRPFDEVKNLHDQAEWAPEGRLATSAGAAIGLIHDVEDAERIVQDVQGDVLRRLPIVQKANSARWMNGITAYSLKIVSLRTL